MPPPKTRDTCFCLAVLINRSDEILLLRRDRHDDFAPGLWGLPGGHRHDGESPEQTIRRELREEIGSNLRLQLLRQVGPVRDTLYGGRFEIHLFLYRYEGGSLVLNDEHDARAWVSPEVYRTYTVVDGIDEDLRHLAVWGTEFQNPAART